ncbi:carboxypeptidase regulatory-like domain-containing protein [Actinomadura rupiterrae]|uniref:carboxypeptidase regulatory-like domain-containing protein n=1 Tax=Actinomadura rupiterrae TaxID=559627 RepID=UPI0020A413D2|nr:carboxypeptidase regulatory-like domain-containing protein [Actinomadura rupiterrae]MCP2338934.1 hypothetical protein [Actinomadura rupiterrae]
MSAEAAVGGGAWRDAVHTAKVLVESLWFPAVFFVGFLMCYLLPFHNPTPRDVPLAVPEPAVQVVQRGLQGSVPGWFSVRGVPARPQALVGAVRTREVVAAYWPDSARPTLFVAGANGAEIGLVTQQVFTKAAAAQGRALTVVDVAPTAPKDGMGTSLFYLGLAMTIPAYVTVMMMLRAASFSRARKVITYVVVGALASVIAFYVALAMDCIPNRPLAILFIFMLSQAVALTGYGLVPFVRQLFPGVAVTIFVLLAIPSSGGAIPIYMVPRFFHWLHPVLPIGNLIDALRSHFYFDDHRLTRPVVVLASWIVAGIVLITSGWLLERRRIAASEAETGARVTAAELECTVEDPFLEMPEPAALHAHMHRIGSSDPQLYGRVETSGSRRLPGVRILVTAENGDRLVTTRTDDQGEYRITGLPEGTLYVVAGGEKLLPAIARTVVRPGILTHQDFLIEPDAPDPTQAADQT